MNVEKLQTILKKYKQYKRILEKIICQKLDKLEEMNEFIEPCMLPRTNQKKIENLNVCLLVKCN